MCIFSFNSSDFSENKANLCWATRASEHLFLVMLKFTI